MQVIHPPTRITESQSGLVDNSRRYVPVPVAPPVPDQPKTIRKKVIKKSPVAKMAPEIPAPVAAAPAPVPAPVAAPVEVPVKVKKTKVKKAAEDAALAKAAETPQPSEDEKKPVARKGRFEKGSQEAKDYMKSIREKAASKKAKAE